MLTCESPEPAPIYSEPSAPKAERPIYSEPRAQSPAPYLFRAKSRKPRAESFVRQRVNWVLLSSLIGRVNGSRQGAYDGDYRRPQNPSTCHVHSQKRKSVQNSPPREQADDDARHDPAERE